MFPAFPSREWWGLSDGLRSGGGRLCASAVLTTEPLPAMMARMKSMFHLADKVWGGDLAAWLRAQRAEQVSYRRLARALAERGIPVTAETVRNWCKREAA